MAGESTASPVVPRATRYDDLLRYVPTNMESVLAFDLTKGSWPKKITDVWAHVSRGVLAGRRFMFPSKLGMGDFEGIILLEAPGKSGKLLRAEKESVYVFSYATFDVHRTKDDQPLFYTQITPRQMLYATTEAMMREALKARGPGGSVLAATMGWPNGVPWESSLVLLRSPDPSIPDEGSKKPRRVALWLKQDRFGEEKPAPFFRITHLVMYASDPARLEFVARVKLRDSIKAHQLPKRPMIWESWGGFGFDDMRAKVEGGTVVMNGNLRPLFDREHPWVAAIVAFGMLGVRIGI